MRRQQAAKKGHAAAAAHLGALLERGLGVQMDLGKAVDCYRRAAKVMAGT